LFKTGEGDSEAGMRVSCRRIVDGSGEGEALVTKQAINFLSMIDLKSGIVKDEKHDLCGKTIANKVLVFPNSVGSSVGAYSFYALRMNKVAPRAIVCNKADITTASGCAIARIPLVDKPDTDILAIRSGAKVKLEGNVLEIY
jgi:hypothetical protein